MRKLVEGIVRFRREMRPGYRAQFAHLALDQRPDTLLVACSDSRVVPNTFASTDPGALSVLRNPGNIVPTEDASRVPAAAGAAAAVEFAVRRLGVTDAVVCGHSDCGAMKAMPLARRRVPARWRPGSRLPATRFASWSGARSSRRSALSMTAWPRPTRSSSSNT